MEMRFVIGGEDKAKTLSYLVSILAVKHKDRVTYDEETGKVSFNAEGLKENKKGQFKNKDAQLIASLVGAEENYFFAVSHNHNPHVEVNLDGEIDGEHTHPTQLGLPLGTYNYGDGQELYGEYALESFTSVSVTPRGDEGKENPATKEKHKIPSTRPTEKSGYQGVLYISPGAAFKQNKDLGTYNNVQTGFIRHELKEIFLRTSAKMSYVEADKEAGGVSKIGYYKLEK